ncbi:MAG: DUF1236 domain-containing protein [Xanthobacteraceae bacterium]|nr:DUF1236 domain-containing protein [Xanthobacteraceae bacterium]
MSQGGASSGSMGRGGSAEPGNAGAASQMDRASDQRATGKGTANDKSSQSSSNPSGAESKSGERSQSSQADRDRGMGANDRDKNQSTQTQQGGSRAGQNAAQQNTPNNQSSQGTQTGQAGRAGTAGQSGTTTGQAGTAGTSGTAGTAGAAGQSGTSTATTGAVGGEAGSNVTLNTEQKTRIRETVLSGSNVPRVNNVNFALNVGTVVPQNVRFAPLPPALVEINPGWRSYEYFVVQEEIIIIDPHSRKIIAVLPV